MDHENARGVFGAVAIPTCLRPPVCARMHRGGVSPSLSSARFAATASSLCPIATAATQPRSEQAVAIGPFLVWLGLAWLGLVWFGLVGAITASDEMRARSN
ncbi:MAG TPA: hypothetical protein VKP30_12530 [Polyangiaceae bacterium]|nr:hypothetical protein [Polyangiaceae bacterium]